MQVSDENSAELANFEFRTEKLVLSSFATVKQPEFRSLGQAEGDTGNIARSRRYARASSEKSNLQSLNYLNQITQNMLDISRVQLMRLP